MNNFKSQIDLFLTEISIELLGNKFYDINGIRQDKIINLFKAPKCREENKNIRLNENSNDFLVSLGYHSNFTNSNGMVKAFLSDQLDHILKNANTSSQINGDIIRFLKQYKEDCDKLSEDTDEISLKKISERTKLLQSLNKARINRFNNDKISYINKAYREERDELLKMSMDTIRLIKYIINDPRNSERKGEMIGFVHAIRSMKDKVYPDSSTTLPAKPYSRSRPKQK